jgi:hypothetical protein
VWGACAGTDGGGKVETGLDPERGLEVAGMAPAGLGLVGTCIGTDPIPICTDGTDVGTPIDGMRGLVDDGAEVGGGMTCCCAGCGGGVMPTPWAGLGSCTGSSAEVGNMVEPEFEMESGGGGTAVLDKEAGCAIGGATASGGGVGG